MTITGSNIIGGQSKVSGNQTFQAVNPVDGQDLQGSFSETTNEEVDSAVLAAEDAFLKYSGMKPEKRAAFLEAIGDSIMDLGDVLIDRAMAETALPQGRLIGERGRTVNQLRMFANLLREGSWVDARIDLAQPDRKPIPKVDLRHMLIAIGPVGIFGASNFPLAFSVAGGDTASALAAGCPVVVKGHPSHPGTCELVGNAIVRAAKNTNMPGGVFSLVQGKSHEVGGAIVTHPLMAAIGFTGSYKGGKALFDLANKRPDPIPVYAEMGSTNPVFILPGALKTKGEEIAKGMAASINLGVGQFCTNPGLVIVPNDSSSQEFKSSLAQAIEITSGGTMLNQGIKESYLNRLVDLQKQGVTHLAAGKKEDSNCGVASHIYNASYKTYRDYDSLKEEIFGPATILIYAKGKEEFFEMARNLEGHLTATIHGTREDLKLYSKLIKILQRKVGRLLLNGYPTGVEVCPSMVHGGPFPATTDVRTTSVGTNAIKRFARPVCFQNFHSDMLPPELQDENPLDIWRLINNKLSKEPIKS